jgi:hypothetical protein
MNLYEGYYVKLKGEKRIARVKTIYHVRHWNDKEVDSEHYEFNVTINGNTYTYDDVEAYAETKNELQKKLKEKAAE